MRLLKVESCGELALTKDEATPHAAYVILSHTWGADDDEVTFDDIEKKTGKNKAGYSKLWFCANQARKDGLDYCWVDTCCTEECQPWLPCPMEQAATAARIARYRSLRIAPHVPLDG